MSTTKSSNRRDVSKRIGILGGSFDPVHYGHIYPAIETVKWLNLAHLHLLPAYVSPHKTGTTATAKQRKEMLELACQNIPELKIDCRELNKPTPSFTINTIKAIRAEFPTCQLFFIMGMDSLLNFTRWHQWQEILEHSHLVINARPNYELAKAHPETHQKLSKYFVDDLNALTGLNSGRIVFHQQVKLNISSTELRLAISKQTFDQEKLPKAVINYIKQHNLYQ